MARVKAAAIDYGASFDSISTNIGPENEVDVRGATPTVHFHDPNKHLIELRSYDELVSSKNMKEVEITGEYVELYKVLKFEGAASSGGEAKAAVDAGLVSVNGEVETRKRRKLIVGDTIEFQNEVFKILGK